MIHFAERLKSTFDALNTTAHKFSGSHGFNRSSMFGMLNGKTRPNLDMLERLCLAEPRISAEYLLRGEGEPLRDNRRSVDLTTVEELRALKVEIDAALDRRINELNSTLS